MKYLRTFEKETNYTNYKNSSEWITPNVSFIKETGRINCKSYEPIITETASLCDVAYWDGSNVKTVSKDKWSATLGTPVGVVVIPKGMLPDGKARIISLYGTDDNGNKVSSNEWFPWEYFSDDVDTSLTNYTKVPTTDNAGSTSNGSDSYGFLPSDKFTYETSYVDPKAKYNSDYNLIPSPYLGNDKTLNPEYCKTISNYQNALSDFNGLLNTQTLVGLGSNYQAANACWKYKDGASNLQWYLPAMGELGFLMPRFNEINNVITNLGGFAVDSGIWSSSEVHSFYAYYLHTNIGLVYDSDKTNHFFVRPFGLLA